MRKTPFNMKKQTEDYIGNRDYLATEGLISRNELDPSEQAIINKYESLPLLNMNSL
jgi:hypothetical protein